MVGEDFQNGITYVNEDECDDPDIDPKFTVTRNVVVGNSPNNIDVPDGTILAGNIVDTDTQN